MMGAMDTDERLERIRRARAAYDRVRSRADVARAELIDEITAALAECDELPASRKRELGPSALGRAAGYTREYITKLRDGTA